MWIEIADCEPMEDGYYLVQMETGYVTGLEYTFAGGWNTHIDYEGNLRDDGKIESSAIARWLDAPKPPKMKDIYGREVSR